MIGAGDTAPAGPGGLPSPIDFVLESLEARGGLIEPREDSAVVLLPPDLAGDLDLPEECHLALRPARRDEIACGLGSPLLERLVAKARGAPAVASVEVDADPPRPSQARAAAERFALRNGLCDIVEISIGPAAYVAAFLAYVVESDDRREGLARVVLSAEDGAEPDAALAAMLDPTWPNPSLRPARAPAQRGAIAERLEARAVAAVRASVEPLLAEVRRRHARDPDRIAAYFADLAAETRAPRRRADPKAVEAKIAHLVTERDRKLAALPARFSTRVTLSLAALVCAEIPAARISARLRRRKESREIALRVPAGASAVDRPACAACGAPTPRPAACDERMHLLCEACAPVAQGRIPCLACARRR